MCKGFILNSWGLGSGPGRVKIAAAEVQGSAIETSNEMDK